MTENDDHELIAERSRMLANERFDKSYARSRHPAQRRPGCSNCDAGWLWQSDNADNVAVIKCPTCNA